jgi:hypothetical protein
MTLLFITLRPYLTRETTSDPKDKRNRCPQHLALALCLVLATDNLACESIVDATV